MSQRGKRQTNRFDNDEPPPSKRRKGRPPAKVTAAIVEDEEATAAMNASSSSWQPRPITDLKMTSIYNRSAPEAPAELFRKDLISAMKLPDSEPLAVDEYWVISDPWKQEWERGVQVPVNPDSLPAPLVSAQLHQSFYTGRQDFKLPKNKFIRITKDESFSSEKHYLSNTPAMAEAACAYDLDQCDDAWLNILNGERAMAGLVNVSDEQFERVVEELEVRCWDKIQAIMKSEEGLGIEYDENVICDVCRSPDSEEANEMVFCDSCNICVHQACYGITAIPSGSWLCRTCAMGKRPDCVLCPNKGGAMKSTRSGHKWAHVSCALWIPEVSIGSVDRMEPITKISSIPQSRWALICVLCRERVGACIQCSVKPCKTAYHVTCAFQHGLEMRAIIEDENAEDGVKLRSYCLKHSVNRNKKEKCSSSNNNAGGSGSEDEDNKRKKQRKDMTTEERNLARIKRLQEVEAEFDKHVNIRDISCHLLDVDQEAIHCIYNYWILKRKSTNNRPLLPPKSEDVDMIAHKQEPADLEKMKMFVHLRQDLERVRNLCYMVSRREKLSRSFFKMREQIFYKQIVAVSEIVNEGVDVSDIQAVLHANHGPSFYDKLYSDLKSYNSFEQIGNIDEIMARVVGIKSSTTMAIATTSTTQTVKSEKSGSHQLNKIDLNGLTKETKKRLTSQSSDNPYKRSYFNGASTTRSSSIYGSSLSSESDAEKHNHLRSSSTEDQREDPRLRVTGPGDKRSTSTVSASHPTTPTTTTTTAVTAIQKKKLSAAQRNAASSGVATTTVKSSLDTKAERRKRRTTGVTARANKKSLDSSTEDDADNHRNEKRIPRNRLLRQMERELDKYKVSGTESDELIPIRNMSGQHIATGENKKIPLNIYSDSDDSTDKDKTDNTASDSQQHPFRTKAAMKEFNMQANKVPATTSAVAPPRLKEVEMRGNSNDKDGKAELDRLEKDRLEKERVEAVARQEKEKLMKERVEKENAQKEKLEKERQQREILEKVQRDKEQAKEKAEKVQREKAVEEKERLHKEKIQREKALEEKDKLQKVQKEKLERERLQLKEKTESERLLKEHELAARQEKHQQLLVQQQQQQHQLQQLQHQKEKVDRNKEKSSKGYPTDLLVVPQRKAAKKASENMMRTTVTATAKKDIKDARDDDRDPPKERKESSKEKELFDKLEAKPIVAKESPLKSESTSKPRGRVSKSVLQQQQQQQSTKQTTSSTKDKSIEPAENIASSTSSTVCTADTKPSKEKVDKDLLMAYVPQRQAAKKAAEHIKGLGKPIADVGVPPAAAVTSSDEKSAKSSTQTSSQKKTAPVLVTSGSSSDSSTNSSSCSSTSSSSDSDEDESVTPSTRAGENKDSKSDKAKELPFLNKEPKSPGSVTSNDSSSSDSETTASSDASSDEEPQHQTRPNNNNNNNRNKRTPTKAAQQTTTTTTTTATPKKNRKEPEKKLKTSELDRTSGGTFTGSAPSSSSSSISSKREEPTPSPAAASIAATTPTTTAPKSVGRGGKRQSISNDRRRSIDIRPGNLVKGAKVSSAESQQQSNNKSVVTSNSANSSTITATSTTTAATTAEQIEFNSSKIGRDPITSPTATGSAARKRKSSILEESGRSIEQGKFEKAKSISTTTSSGSTSSSTPVKPSTSTNKESRKSSELSPKKRETHEKLTDVNTIAAQQLVGSLEQEISERKASSNNRLNKSTGSLDKLLSKRERDVLKAAQQSPVKENREPTNLRLTDDKPDVAASTNSTIKSSPFKMSTPSNSDDVKSSDSYMKGKSTIPIEIIDITDTDDRMTLTNTASTTRSSPLHRELIEDKKCEIGNSVKHETNIFVSGENKKSPRLDVTNVNDPNQGNTQMHRSIFSPAPLTTENCSTFNSDNDCGGTGDDPFTISTGADPSTPISFPFPTDILFKQDNKEDSAKETMDLVGKLRQKFKKSTSVNEKSRNEPQIIEIDTSPEESLDTTERSSDAVKEHIPEPSTMPLDPTKPKNDANIINLIDQDDSSSKDKTKLDHSLSVPSDERWVPPSASTNVQMEAPSNEQFAQQLQQAQNHLFGNTDQHLVNKLLTATGDNSNAIAVQAEVVSAAAQDFLMQMQEQAKFSENSIENMTNILQAKFLQNEVPPTQQLLPVPSMRHHDSADENDHSPYMRPVNKWTENEMIQTRRSVSSSPSSASECNEDDMQQRVEPPHIQQYRMMHQSRQPQHHLQQLQSLQQQHQHQELMMRQQQDSHAAHIRKMNDIAFTNMHPDLQAFSLPSQPDLVDPMNPFNFNDSGQYTGPVSLFPPAGHNVQLPFPSPGAAMFPPNFGQTFGVSSTTATTTTAINHTLHQQQQHHLQQHMPLQQQQQHSPIVTSKLDDRQHQQQHLQHQTQLTYPANPCGAAFTSSSHNMALTEAIVSPQANNNMIPTSQHQAPHNSMASIHLQQSNHVPVQDTSSSNELQQLHGHMRGNNDNFIDHTSQQSLVPVVKISPIDSDLAQHQEKATTKRSTRIVAQQAAHNIQQQLAKSPSKSPSKSPRQPTDVLRQQQQIGVTASGVSSGGKGRGGSGETGARGRKNYVRNTGATRGQGRQRGRGRGARGGNANITHHMHIQQPMSPYSGGFHGTMHNKLAGTVYDLDFDEDLAGENVENLKAMRDRRRSIDCRQDQFRSRDASQSPKFASPNSHKSRMPFNQSDIRDLRPPTPVRRDSAGGGGGSVTASTPASIVSSAMQPPHLTSPTSTSIHSIVSPVLPGPVDMRTYNSGFDTTNTEAYNSSLLGAFASGTADQTLPDIDEEMEKALQSALKASNTKPNVPTTATTPTVTIQTIATTITATMTQILATNDAASNASVSTVASSIIASIDVPSEEASIDSDTLPPHPQVSLFKLKIKGPHAHPDNYTSTTVAQLQPNIAHEQTPLFNAAPNLAPGPSNLRRMRKKELLRQYWTQDMNMDDTNCVLPAEHAPPTHASFNSSTGGRGVGIPKAVDSMSSIPTKDDYKDYATMDLKKRKAGMSRELRQLDIAYDTEIPERRRSVGSNASSNSTTNTTSDVSKRVTRTKQQLATMITPKLKIKIGNSADATMITTESSLILDRRIRPPKKRLANMPVPSLEDLKRESMNFRKQVMGEFDEAEKVKSKKSKSSKSERREEKRKRKKEKKRDIEIISNNDTDAPKLIIRIGKRKAEETLEDVDSGVPTEDVDPLALNSPTTVNNRASSSNSKPANDTSPIITPIRLKIARNSQGSSYVAIGDKVSGSSSSNSSSGGIRSDSSAIKLSAAVSDETTTISRGSNNKSKSKLNYDGPSVGGDKNCSNNSGSSSSNTGNNSSNKAQQQQQLKNLDPLHPRLNPSVVISDVNKMNKYKTSELSETKQFTTISTTITATTEKRTNTMDPDPNASVVNKQMTFLSTDYISTSSSCLNTATTTITANMSSSGVNAAAATNVPPSSYTSTSTTATSANSAATATDTQQQQQQQNEQDPPSRKGCPPLPLSKDCEVR